MPSVTTTPKVWARVCAIQERRWARDARRLDVYALLMILIAAIPPQVSWGSLACLVVALAYRWLGLSAKSMAAAWRSNGEHATRATLDPDHAEQYLDSMATDSQRFELLLHAK